MPAPVVAAAGIGAGASLAGGILGSRSQSKATDANLQAQREALAYEREKEAARKAEYDKAMELYKQQMDAWNANRRALAGRYGVNIPAPAASAGPAVPAAPGGAVPRGGLNLGMIAAGRPGGTPMGGPAPAPMPPADPYSWEDWSQYAPIR